MGSGVRARRNREAGGFTLVEVVVVLTTMLAGGTLAGVVLDRLIVHARTAEAIEMLREISSRERAFEASDGRFLTLRSDQDGRAAVIDEDAAGFFPLPADSPALAPGRVAARIDNPARWPAGWRALGVHPRGAFAYCTFLANAGDGPVPAGLRFGSALLLGAPSGRWFYALAACNLAGPAGYPNDVTVFGVSSQSSQVRTFNQGR